MKQRIKIEIESRSNLFIGGTPAPFEIGGIDQWTSVDEEGFPCIPASSLKGALRAIVAADQSVEAAQIAEWYRNFLEQEQKKNQNQMQEYFRDNKEALERIQKRYQRAVHEASAWYLFGIREFNNTPKLLFDDLRLKKEYRKLESCFSIDTKTAISCEGKEPKSNPRTYKAARAGLKFEGTIELYGFDTACFPEEAPALCRKFLITNLEKFNEGIYRLGNSRSRGYGKIFVSVVEENGGEDCEEL